jgi:hypothetical protein
VKYSFLLLAGYSVRLIRFFLLYLSAGIKEGLYDMEALAGYLLYRLTVLNPICKLSLKGIPEEKAQTQPVLCLSGFFCCANF